MWSLERMRIVLVVEQLPRQSRMRPQRALANIHSGPNEVLYISAFALCHGVWEAAGVLGYCSRELIGVGLTGCSL